MAPGNVPIQDCEAEQRLEQPIPTRPSARRRCQHEKKEIVFQSTVGPSGKFAFLQPDLHQDIAVPHIIAWLFGRHLLVPRISGSGAYDLGL